MAAVPPRTAAAAAARAASSLRVPGAASRGDASRFLSAAPRRLILPARPRWTAPCGLSAPRPFSAAGGGDALRGMIDEYASRKMTSVSLETLMATGRGEYLHRTGHGDAASPDGCSAQATAAVLAQVASFLRRELPVRLAHRVRDLEGVPILNSMPSVMEVRGIYVRSLEEMAACPMDVASTPEGEEKFARMLEEIYGRHAGVLVTMARGAFELRKGIREGTVDLGGSSICDTREDGEMDFERMSDMHAFLDRFYLSRIGIRMLIGQYLSLRQPEVNDYVGTICARTSPYEIVQQATDDATFMCARKYGDAPEVVISGGTDMTFPYVPTHLHYIMLELIKNSMRATVEWHGVDSDYPPIRVVIADGNENEDVVVKVSDEGGGIPRSYMDRIWSYLFTTADPAVQEGMVAFGEDADHSIDSPLAGLGYGLPISRAYARYFGGEVSIMSMEGFGTDAFVYLTRLGKSREPLP
mmetsp:Transcript_6666/g.13877  ORF Transcript_6666/g.13877 Transcript_6666/m.13877 type:complete len:470 (-) Transcript_6666:308-1717(-)